MTKKCLYSLQKRLELLSCYWLERTTLMFQTETVSLFRGVYLTKPIIHHVHLIFSLFVVLIDSLIRWFDVTESRSYRMVLEVLGQLKILILCFPKVSFILWTLYYRSTEQIYGFVTWFFNVFSKTFYMNSSFWSHQR